MSHARVTSPVKRYTTALTALVVGLAGVAGAQGTLSTQGYGFHPGQLSTRAQGTGGALGETDPFSPLNPATLGALGGKFLSFQIEPEFRTVSTGGTNTSSRIARYPLFLAVVPVGERWVVGLSSSTLLDRTWATAAVDTERIGGDDVESRSDHSVSGAMNDLRFATAWTNRRWLRVGLGIHAITGRNQVTLSRVFPDSSSLADFSQAFALSFEGTALSGGAEVTANRIGTLSLSYRKGGRVHAEIQDSLIAVSDVPDRFGIGATYIGLRGSTFAVRASHQSWSSLTSLGATTSTPVDGWDVSAGADFSGPRLAGRPLAFRGGVRSRTLPYQAGNRTVKEKSAALGTGFSLAGGLVIMDLAAIRSFRDAGIGVKERAWTMSIGLSTRP
jgi:hypothetical protein